MAYTTEKDAYGNTVLFQDGGRIATGTESAINAQKAGLETPKENSLTTPPAATPTSRYTDETSGLFAEGGLYGDRTPLTPDEESKVRETERGRVQAQIDAIEEIAQRNYAEIAQRGRQAEGRTRARLSATGQIGSGGEGAAFGEAERPFVEERRLVEKEKAAAVAGIYSRVDERAREIIKEERTTARENTAQYLDYLSKTSENARADMTSLATAGADLTPDQRSKLIEQTGYDETTFDQLYKSVKIANAPADEYLNKDKPQIVGNKAIFFKRVKNADGTFSITTEELDLPEGATTKKVKQTVNTAEGVMVLYEDGTFERIGEVYQPPQRTPLETPAQVAKRQGDATKLKAVGDMAKKRANEVITLANELKEDSSVKNSVIGFRGVRGLIGTPGAKDYLNKVRRLKALLAVDSIKDFKGFGAMSDREFSTAGAAASTITLNEDKGRIEASPTGFDDELNRILSSMNLVLSDTGDVVDTGSDGTSVKDRAASAGYDYDAMASSGYSDEEIEAALQSVGF